MPKIVDREEMQDGILDAAMIVFTERGYHAATIADVAEAAGLGKGTLYLYFDNKEAMTEAMVERHFAGLEARFMATALPEDLKAFIAWLDQTMNVQEDHAKFVRMFFEIFGPSFASESFSAVVSAFFEKLGTHYARALAHLQKAGAVRSDVDPRLLGRSLASVVDGMILHRGLFGLSRQRYARMRRETLDVIAKGITTD
ncbi:TetR/AcrR family transcriptional regulator [Bauldia sp.]|uniref:TetR/AcrR family transcriptional regulator n=1 Tax=Bauldia sp. TaxID=2575872 RepID=UPI003BAB963C